VKAPAPDRAGRPDAPVVSPDPADTKFVLCAMAGEAEFIVTGNKRHLSVTQR
jgi:predicted nucleic acid-binding protein